MSGIHVYSEIKPLKKVLLHRPGDEFLNLTPNTLERLLFDDIPYLKKAQEEHDVFAGALRAEGVEVVYLVDLAAEALDTHPKVREKFLKQFIKEGGVTSPIVFDLVFNYLNQFKDNRELIKKCITGIDSEDLEGYRPSSGFFATRDIGKMILDPLPNLYAPRDPFASIGDGVSVHRMYSVTRQRETIFAEYIFKYHPEYKDTPKYYDRYNAYHIEGGDIQVLSDEVIAIGISERTEPDAINLLAKNIFSSKGNKFKYVLAFDIPDERSFMHLDTVMTRLDVDKFAVHSQVMHVTKVFEISKGKTEEELNIIIKNSVMETKYRNAEDAHSAYEKIEEINKAKEEELNKIKEAEQKQKEEAKKAKEEEKKRKNNPFNKAVTKATNSALNSIGRHIGNAIVRGILGTKR